MGEERTPNFFTFLNYFFGMTNDVKSIFFKGKKNLCPMMFNDPIDTYIYVFVCLINEVKLSLNLNTSQYKNIILLF